MNRVRWRSAGFQTCCIADFQVGNTVEFGWPADLEIRDTADLEVCATSVAASPRYKKHGSWRASTPNIGRASGAMNRTDSASFWSASAERSADGALVRGEAIIGQGKAASRFACRRAPKRF